MRASKSSASSTNGAPGSSTAPCAAHRPPESPPAPPVIGTPRGSRGTRRELVQPRSEPLDHRGVGALLGRRPRRVLEWRADVAQHDDLRASRPPPRPRSPPARPRRRRSWRSRRRPPGSPAAPAPRPPRSARRCRRWTPPRRHARRRHQPEPAGHRHLDDRRPPSSTSPKPVSPAPERVADLDADQLAAELGEQGIQRALAAVGHRAQVRRHQPRALEPAADRPGHLGALNVPLNESGATSTGAREHHAASCQASRRGANRIRGLRARRRGGPALQPRQGLLPAVGVTKGELAHFYVDCADAVLNHLRERPTVLKRYAGGIEAKPFYQKRVPAKRPEWLQTMVLKFPSGRTAEEFVPVDAAHLVWAVSLGNVDFNPHPVRRADLDHPGRAAGRPRPDAGRDWDSVRKVALLATRRARPSTACAATRRRPARAGSTSRSASIRSGTSSPSAAPRWRWRARSSAAARVSPRRSGGRRSARTARSSSTTTRTPRTTRSPPLLRAPSRGRPRRRR